MAEWNTQQIQNLFFLGSSPSGSTAELGCGTITLLRYQMHMNVIKVHTSFFDSSAAIWTFSSVGKSNRLITGRPGVRVPEGPLLFRIDTGYSVLFNMLCSYREASTGVMTWNVKTAPHPG